MLTLSDIHFGRIAAYGTYPGRKVTVGEAAE